MSRAFGWNRDGTVNADEAETVRRIADWIADGGATKTLATQLNDEGLRTATGKPWTVQVINRALKNPRMIGHRLKDGRLIVDDTVDPILDRTQWDKVVEHLTSPDRDRFIAPKLRQWLLAGKLVCGHCGSAMWLSNGAARSECGASISQAAVERDVAEYVLATITSPAWLTAVAAARDRGPDHYRETIAMADDRMRTLAEVFGAGDSEEVALMAGVEAARRVRGEAERELATLDAVGAVDALTDVEIVSWWEGAAEVQRRAVIDVVVGRIVVAPAEKGLRLADRLTYVSL